jgi:hypothetical protein
MKETAFWFVSLQQQRPDLPRLLVSTETVDDSLSLSLSLSSWHAAYLSICCMLRLVHIYLVMAVVVAVMCGNERADSCSVWVVQTCQTLISVPQCSLRHAIHPQTVTSEFRVKQILRSVSLLLL